MNGGDVLVVGAGAAGLAVALRLAAHRRVVLLCKAQLGHGAATGWAQGGIAAAIGEDDSPALHIADTEAAGGGLSDHHAVEILAREAAQRVAEMIALGAHFDRDSDGRLALGREAAHSRRRILHAGGDATGRELLRTLVEAVTHSSITVLEGTALDLRVEAGRVNGLKALIHNDGATELATLETSAVVFATGGCGRLYTYTTNPLESCGDGLAMALRAGVDLVDLEFVQFHPTALAAAVDPMPLVTEALRGEGAVLIDGNGRALMAGRDPRGDLAPRDIVARVIFEALSQDGTAFLDARAVPDVARRFPSVAAAARAAGIDIATEPLPIAPAAHYHMGGIATDDHGRSSLRGLWACGETASTGAHGANRLASNSLLEALVFGARVADDILASATPTSLRPYAVTQSQPSLPQRLQPIQERMQAIRRLRAVMYDRVGLVRSEASLRLALREIEAIVAGTPPVALPDAFTNMSLLASAITEAALRRRESRGSHFRLDYPVADPLAAIHHHTLTPTLNQGAL